MRAVSISTVVKQEETTSKLTKSIGKSHNLVWEGSLLVFVLGVGIPWRLCNRNVLDSQGKSWAKPQQAPSRRGLLSPAMGQQQPSTVHQLQPGVKGHAFACPLPITLVLVPPLVGIVVQAAMQQLLWVPLGLITAASHLLRWCYLPQALFSFSDFQWGAQMGYSVSAESNKRLGIPGDLPALRSWTDVLKLSCIPRRLFMSICLYFWTISVWLDWASWTLCSWEWVSFTELMPKIKNYLKLKVISRNRKDQMSIGLPSLLRVEK